jgi:hypothetical protein
MWYGKCGMKLPVGGMCVLLPKGLILSTSGYALRYMEMRNGFVVVIILSLFV